MLASFILRPSASSAARHAEYRSSHAWASPVVGVHIRRTDKVTSKEAKHHGVPEYMAHVERYCDWKLAPGWQERAQHSKGGAGAVGTAPGLQQPAAASIPHCSVYLATDEPAVVKEIEENFPHIQVITNPVALATGALWHGTGRRQCKEAQTVASTTSAVCQQGHGWSSRTVAITQAPVVPPLPLPLRRLSVPAAAGDTSHRNSKDGGQGVYDDTILLSSTDYLVGTFSSQVSRLAYEIALVNGSSSQPAVTDPSLHYHSVDSMWYFGGMQHYEYCTIHVSPAQPLPSCTHLQISNGERQPRCPHSFFCCVQQCRLFLLRTTLQDFTVMGQPRVKAGQHVDCNAMYEFEAGLIKCSLLPAKGTDSTVYLPPAVLGRCTSFIRDTATYPNLLPEYMRRPAQQQAAVAAA